ncbi:DUF5343 domain-containing protein [Neorhizobium galegae]|uniref:DUF5343 domain-containing protein n=1 Tax=Neorhizobium galegae TaxID=399 RepID=UPI002102FAC7|nr:DUF5343 domain-containing protein [Neorhizobium galegae]MCQ1854250.1 DUF5343 domain-containing protein [Neorhizobium galegae]
MGDFAYTIVTGKIRPLLEKIRMVGIPQKVGKPWLKTIGYTSSNDSSLVGVLKFIGFIDGSGIPTSVWTAYRGASGLIETKESGLGFLFGMRCATIPHAYRDHI